MSTVLFQIISKGNVSHSRACASVKVNSCSQVNAALNQFVNATALQWLRFGMIFKLEFFAATNTVLGAALQKR